MTQNIKIKTLNLSVAYKKDTLSLKNVNIDIYDKQVTALIGPSGCGKSTFLRSINRMNDLILNSRVMGEIWIDNRNINTPAIDVVKLRSKVGMVFQKPNPFPTSIYENIAYGPRIQGLFKTSADLDVIVENSLTRAGLWDEVKDRLHLSAFNLSGGQQQRLCIARAIAVNPEIILMDEPCSALDIIATAKVEELIDYLKQNYCIVLVTHGLQQALRVSQVTAYFQSGELIEIDKTENLFTNPKNAKTEAFITGKVG